MKALILCAGRGNRMGSVTDKIPKALIQINSKTLLERILGDLEYLSIKDAYVVVGYKKEFIKSLLKDKFKKLNVYFIDNPLYSKLNNLFSVWLAKPFLFEKEFLLINGDIIFDRGILELAVSSELDNFSLIDTAKPVPEDGMKVKLEGNNITDFGKNISNADGFTMGIHKFSGKGSKLLFTEIEDMLENGNDNYHHGAILSLIKKYSFNQKALIIKNPVWHEIDEVEDIKRCEEMFAETK